MLVVGRLKTESWEKDSRKQYKLTVVRDSVWFFVPQNGSSAPVSVSENEPAQEELSDMNHKFFSLPVSIEFHEPTEAGSVDRIGTA